MHISHFNLAQVFDHHEKSRPDVPAIVDGEDRICHADLAQNIRRTADHLSVLGVNKGSRVGLCLSDRAAHLICLLATARLGAITVPMDVRWTAEEKVRLASALGVTNVLVEAQDMEAAHALRMAGLTPCLVDEKWHRQVAAQPGLAEVVLDDDLPLIFALSSGTTAAPKGPMLTHGRMMQRFLNQYVTLTLSGRDRFLAATPLYFGATRAFCLSTLYAGGTVILAPPPLEPPALAALTAANEVSTAFLVPTMLRRLLALDDEALTPFRALRVLISSGAALHPEEADMVLSRICPNLYNYYGTTEGGGVSILGPEDRLAASGRGAPSPGLVGRPVFMVDVEIVDREGLSLPIGETGVVRYRGPGVASDDWFSPGDLGRLDEHGFLYLKGRDAELIIRGGVNIYPREIEEVLLAIDGVGDAAVIGWPSPEFGEEVAAFVVAEPGLGDDVILARCRSALARYKVPKAIIRSERLPRNDSGKLRKDRLLAMLPQQ